MLRAAIVILVGCGLYGFTIGLWRAPLQAWYAAIKLPLLIFATVSLNGVINGMLAQILSSGLGFRQTLFAILQSFAVFAVILASLSPLALYMALNTNPPGTGTSTGSYHALLLTHTCVIAYAGIVANLRLFLSLVEFSRSRLIASRVLIAWLAGNLFVGGQMSFVLRPFFGQPSISVQFLRAHPFEGNFYQSVWYSFRTTLGPTLITFLPLVFFAALILFVTKSMRRTHLLPTQPSNRATPK